MFRENHSLCPHGNEGTCNPVQICCSLMYFNGTLWHRGIGYKGLNSKILILVNKICSFFVLFLSFVHSKKNTELCEQMLHPHSSQLHYCVGTVAMLILMKKTTTCKFMQNKHMQAHIPGRIRWSMNRVLYYLKVVKPENKMMVVGI